MVLTGGMKNALPRAKPPRSPAVALARPRPTAAAALLLASILSLPFVALALGQAVF